MTGHSAITDRHAGLARFGLECGVPRSVLAQCDGVL